MIDTVSFGFPIMISPTGDQGWRYNLVSVGDRSWEKWSISFYVAGKSKLSVTYYPQSITAKANEPLLLFEFSLPKLVYGNNTQMLGDLNEAVEIANKEMNLIAKFPAINFYEGVLYRLDPCYNFDVGVDVYDYLRSLSVSHYSRRKTKPYFGNGVQFYTKQGSLKFYDKGDGFLREEISFLHRRDIENKYQGQKLTIDLITRERTMEILNHELEILNLTTNKIVNLETANAILGELYGTRERERLVNYLIERQSTPKDKMMDKINKSEPTVDLYERQIINAGILMGLTYRKGPLPPLKIESLDGIN